MVRAISFVTLVSGNLLLILINRSHDLSTWTVIRRRANPTVKWIFGGGVLMLALLLTVPALRTLFHFGALSALEVAVAVSAAVASLL